MPARSAFEYATLRVVPDIERAEFLNCGVVLFCRTRRFLDLNIELPIQALELIAPSLEIEPLKQQLERMAAVCHGDKAAGEIASLPQPERFRWIAAPKSTILQTSAVHCGLCEDPASELAKLFKRLVRK